MKKVKLFEQFIQNLSQLDEKDSDILSTYSELSSYEFEKFKKSYQKLHKDNQIVFDNKDNVTYGFRKGSSDAHWKYFHNDLELYHSLKNKEVLGLINFFNQVKKNHPWT